jgi:glycerol-3-phosphate dehydrogenase (NAD(P)+)
MRKIAIIGAGSWGTALAIALGRSSRPHRLALWAHSPDIVELLRAKRINEIYLPGFDLPAGVEVTGALTEALSGAAIVLGVMPSAHAREVYSAMCPHLEPGAVFVSATKGLEPTTHARISEVICDEIGCVDGSPTLNPEWQPGAMPGSNSSPRIAVLSGPSFALEVARGDPTAVVLASADASLGADIQEEFAGPTFRLYTNDDVIGTEIAGAVKNVIAIAAGVCAGLGLGANTTAALVTRGLAEMTRLAVALGGRRDTLAGLAGVGDLILTSTGALSRNRSVGIELGKGRKLGDILSATRMVAEGVGSAAATLELARRVGVEMPIAEQVHAVLTLGRASRDAIRELMERRLKQE